MAKVTGQDIGKELVKVLHLPDNCRWFELRVAVDEVVTVKCGFMPDIDAKVLIEVVNEYELHFKPLRDDPEMNRGKGV